MAKTLRNYHLEAFRKDLVAAFNVALLAFPQGMAYAYIAGVPIRYGIFGSAVATIVGVLFSSSPYIVLGPTNATAIMLFSAFVNLGVSPEEKLVMVPLLLVMVGVMLVVGAYLRVASLTQYVSRTVVTGYITAAAFLIVANQIPHMLGIQVGTSTTFFDILSASMLNLKSFHWPTVLVTGLSLLLYWRLKPYPALPNVAVTLVVITGVTWLLMHPLAEWLAASGRLDLAEDIAGLKLLQWRDGGNWALPQLHFADISRLASTAQAIALLCVLEALSIGKSLAARSGGRLDPNQEMFSMGMANIGCGLFSGMAASGSLTRSSLNNTSGAVTSMSGFFIGVMCLFGAWTLADLVNYVPRATLALLVTLIGISLIDRYHIRMSLKATKSDASVFLGTLVAGLLFPLDTAIYFGTALAIVLFLRKVATPILAEYSLGHDGQYTLMEGSQKRDNPRISIVHVEGQLFFAAAEIFHDQIRRVCEDPKLEVVVLKMRHAQNLDATSIMALKELVVSMKERSRTLLLSEVRELTVDIFKRTGLTEVLGPDNLFKDDDQNPNLSTALAVKRAKALLGERKASVDIVS